MLVYVWGQQCVDTILSRPCRRARGTTLTFRLLEFEETASATLTNMSRCLRKVARIGTASNVFLSCFDSRYGIILRAFVTESLTTPGVSSSQASYMRTVCFDCQIPNRRGSKAVPGFGNFNKPFEMGFRVSERCDLGQIFRPHWRRCLERLVAVAVARSRLGGLVCTRCRHFGAMAP